MKRGFDVLRDHRISALHAALLRHGAQDDVLARASHGVVARIPQGDVDLVDEAVHAAQVARLRERAATGAGRVPGLLAQRLAQHRHAAAALHATSQRGA